MCGHDVNHPHIELEEDTGRGKWLRRTPPTYIQTWKETAVCVSVPVVNQPHTGRSKRRLETVLKVNHGIYRGLKEEYSQ